MTLQRHRGRGSRCVPGPTIDPCPGRNGKKIIFPLKVNGPNAAKARDIIFTFWVSDWIYYFWPIYYSTLTLCWVSPGSWWLLIPRHLSKTRSNDHATHFLVFPHVLRDVAFAGYFYKKQLFSVITYAIPEGIKSIWGKPWRKNWATFLTINNQISILQKNRLNISTLDRNCHLHGHSTGPTSLHRVIEAPRELGEQTEPRWVEVAGSKVGNGLRKLLNQVFLDVFSF